MRGKEAKSIIWLSNLENRLESLGAVDNKDPCISSCPISFLIPEIARWRCIEAQSLRTKVPVHGWNR